MTPVEQLAAARRLLGGPTAADGGAWARAAAVLGRQSLEGAALTALQRRYPVHRMASFRARFLALRAVDEELAGRAHQAWAALSRATHHHGYALPPTVGELLRWLDVVEEVVRAAGSQHADESR